MTTIYGDKSNIHGHASPQRGVSMWNAITNLLRNNGSECYGDSQGFLYETADGKLYRLFPSRKKPQKTLTLDESILDVDTLY